MDSNRMKNKSNVCVFGSAEDMPPDVMKFARLLGNAISVKGYQLVYGGFGKGLLSEVAKGVKDNNGFILAVAPILPRKNNPLFDKIDLLLKSADKRERKKLQIDHSDGFIILPTGIGVLDELFEILVLKSYGIMNKKIIIYNMNHMYDNLVTLLIEQKAIQYCVIVDTLEGCMNELSSL